MLCEAAVASSTSEAFCWVTASIWAMASLTCSMPALCSRPADVISLMMSVTRRTLTTTFSMVVPAWPTSRVPSSTCSTELPINSLISFAADAERCARLRTSDATTAKPRPCSPARAASTAAFSARILVWKAMPSITPMMSTIFFAESLIDPMVSITCDTTMPPCCAMEDASSASALAWRALSEFCLTADVSCSIEAAVSSSELACCSVREDKSRLPATIWLEPVAMVSVARRTSPTMPARPSRMRFMANSKLSLSPGRITTGTDRSPAAIWLAMAAA